MSNLPLPKINSITYTIKLPISQIDVTYRPYNVADEKKLVSIANSKNTDPKFFIKNTIDIAQNNIINDVDVKTLPSVDVRFLFLHLRAKSVSETIDLKYDDKPFSINIEEIYVLNPRDKKDYKILLGEDNSDKPIGLQMRMQTFEQEIIATSKFQMDNDKPEDSAGLIYEILYDSVESIFDENNIWVVGQDITRKDLISFLDQITSKDAQKLYKFIKDMPVLAVDVDLKDGEGIRTITNRELDFLS